MQLKTISILTDGIYPYVLGGMQKHSYYLAKYFAKKGIKVDLYHYIPEGKNITSNLFTDSELSNINQIIVEMPKPDKFVGHYIRQCKAYSKNIVTQLRQRAKTDFIYAQGFTAWALIDDTNIRKKLAPIAVNFHGLEPLQVVADLKSKLQKWMLLPFLKHNLNHADYVFSLGGNLTKLLLDAKIPSHKILEIPIGIEQNWLIDEIPEQNNPIRFLFIGRNERRKGIREYSLAIKEIPQNKAEFHFIGPISMDDLVESENTQVLCSFKNLVFHGSIYNEDKIKSITRNCDILVCPSFSEGMPTVILEAMSSGLSVIATNVGATNELVNDTTGWLINDPEPRNIINALNEIIETEKSIINGKRKNALQHIKQHFLWDNVIELTLKKLNILFL